MKRIILFVLFIFAITVSVFAQDDQKVVADKIVAQIGDRIILKSDVDNTILQMQHENQGQMLPEDLDCNLMQQQIIMKALALQAERVDSLTVSDDDVEDAFQSKLRNIVAYYGSRELVEKAYGKSIDAFRRDIYPDLKEQLLFRKEQQQIVQNVTVSPAEVQAYFNTIPKDSLGYFESQFTASQIVMYPIPNQDVVDNMRKQLEDYKAQVEAGKVTFPELVQKNTDDNVARQDYGLLKINREEDKGRIDPEFLKAAFLLREGQISPVIKDQAGRYHIIQMVSRVGNDAQVRDLVKIPPVTDVEIKMTIEKMDSLHTFLADHKIDFGQAFALYNEDKDARFNGGAIVGNDGGYPVTPFSLDQLQDTVLTNSLAKMQNGDYSDPQVYTNPATQKVGVRIVFLRMRTQPHRENMQDDYAAIEGKALQQKQQQVVEDWVTNHMQDFYIKIDPSYAHCIELSKWNKNSDERIQHFSAGGAIK